MAAGRCWRWLGLLLWLFILATSHGATPEPEVLASVGAVPISASAVQYRLAVERVYGNAEITPEAALISLIQDALAQQVAARLGQAASADEIEALHRHAEAHSKAPERLKQVQAVFGEDRAAYQQLYLAPKVTDRKLRYYHARNYAIHHSAQQAIEQAYQRAKSGQPFAEVASALALVYFSGETAKPNAAWPDALKPYLPAEPAAEQDPLIELLAGLADGEIYANIVEQDHAFQIVRRLSRSAEGIYRIETVTAAKQLFEPWFEEQAAPLKVRILAADLAARIIARYPDLWWVKRED